MNDLPLFAFVPHNGTDTSRAAAESMVPHVSEIERRVLKFVRVAGSATCDEVESVLVMAHQTASARLRGLALKNLIKDSGLRRPTRSGRSARVYVAVAA